MARGLNVRYAVYPLLLGGGSVALLWGLSRGYSALIVVGCVNAAVGLAVAVLERTIPYDASWNRSRGDSASDATHFLVNLSIKQAALATYAVLADSIIARGGIWPSEWPFALQALLALVIIDLFLYLVHRASHRNEYLWRLHAVHHSSERLYWVNGEKRHPLHQVVEGLPGVTATLVLGAPHQVVVAALGILAINMMLQHGNVDSRASLLRYVLSVAELHRLHHRREADQSRVNFGAVFAVWDIVFGTYASPIARVSGGDVGLADEPQFPRGYWAQLTWPLTGSRQPDSIATHAPMQPSAGFGSDAHR